LVERVAELLTEPWCKSTGRSREVDLRGAVEIALIYARHNLTEELLGDFMGVSQSTVSRIITTITPLIEQVTDEFIPTAQEAVERLSGRVALVDGSLAPCWSWRRNGELWAGKYGTTGHNFQVITNLSGEILYISEPMPGHQHDMTVLENTETARILAAATGVIADKGYQGAGFVTPAKKPRHRELYIRERDYNNQVSGLRAPVERAIAHIKNWRILHTDYRRPLNSWKVSFKTAIGLYFFSTAVS
jgi:transposase